MSSDSKKIASLQGEIDNSRKQAERVALVNEQLTHSKDSLTAQVSSLQLQLKDFENNLKTSKDRCRNLDQELATINEKYKLAAENLDSEHAKVARLEESVSTASQEINKGNEIIRHLQGEVGSNASSCTNGVDVVWKGNLPITLVSTVASLSSQHHHDATPSSSPSSSSAYHQKQLNVTNFNNKNSNTFYSNSLLLSGGNKSNNTTVLKGHYEIVSSEFGFICFYLKIYNLILMAAIGLITLNNVNSF